MPIFFTHILNETVLQQSFENVLYAVQKELNVQVKKTLGESSGLAYLTNDNRVLKISASEVENQFSMHLLKDPHPNFPKIYNIIEIKNKKGWYAILKEFIPDMPPKIKKQYLQLENEMKQWVNDDYDLFDDNFIPEIIELATKDKTFHKYINDLEPKLKSILSDLINMMQYANKYNEDWLDLHEDNIGYKNGKLIAFDF